MRLAVDVIKLQKARLNKGYSQRELARQAGISSLAINYLENEKSSPRPSTIKKICTVLNIEVSDICSIE